MDATQFLQFFVNGVVFGAILALGAIGLSLVYGILGISNFAHGDFLTFGAFMALLFGTSLHLLDGLPTAALVVALALVVLPGLDVVTLRLLRRHERLVLAGFGALLAVAAAFLILRGPGGAGTTNTVLVVAGLLSLVFTVLLTVGLEFAVWRPLRRKRATLLTLVIVSIGVSLVVRNALQRGFGAGNRSLERPNLVAESFGGVLVSPAQQFTILACIVLITALHLFLRRTRTGKAMRAMADNLDLARVSGIDVDRVVVYVWAIAGALVAIAGILLTLVQNNNMTTNMGFSLILPLFAAVILGGIGSPYGAMLGALLVGVAMKTSALWIGTEYELASAFLILIAVLLTRPQGLLGVRS